MFEDLVISKDLWPKRSPDLTPPDFCLWRSTNRKVGIRRGGQTDQLREQHFRSQQYARAMFSTLKFIKSKYRSVLTDEHLTELVQTASTTYRPNFKKLTAYP
jgi:hypothetical protein